jgi:hypothetical protein
MRLHSQLQTAKVARLAHRFVIVRGAWQTWINAIEERKKKRKLKEFEIVIMRKIFIGMRFTLIIRKKLMT